MIRNSTIFLRLAVLAIGLAVLTLGVLLFPSLWQVPDEYPRYGFAVYVVMIIIYVTTIPYYLGLFKAWSILNMIDRGEAFATPTVKALQFVARCCAAISALYALSLPFFYLWADGDDAPGLVVIGMIFTFVPMVVAVSMAVLQRLLHDAITLKNENDLTV